MPPLLLVVFLRSQGELLGEGGYHWAGNVDGVGRQALFLVLVRILLLLVLLLVAVASFLRGAGMASSDELTAAIKAERAQSMSDAGAVGWTSR